MSRREFVSGASMALAATGALASLRCAAIEERPLAELSAVEALERLRHGTLSAMAYAKALIERCEAGRSLNAFITLEPEHVLNDARAADRWRAAGKPLGPLHGLPIPIKDIFNTRDYPTTAGTPALRHFRPTDDAPLVSQLRAAGAIVLGKANLHELSYGWSSNNHAFGAVHNPYDPSRVPGGSSGGSAAAVAARMAPIGIAADTDGSIRVPAAACGLVGFRPTTGRYSTAGAAPISGLFDQVGPVTRCMADAVLFDSVIAPDPTPLTVPDLRRVRLATCRAYYFQGLDPEVARLTDAALAKLTDAGVTLIDTDLPGLSEFLAEVTDPVQEHDIRSGLTDYLLRSRTGVTFDELVAQASDDIRKAFAEYVLPSGAKFTTDAAYERALHVHLPKLRKLYQDAFRRTGADAFVFPTLMITAPRIGDEALLSVGGRQVPFDEAMSRNIAPGSTVGMPGLVLPAGIAADGLPVSIELDGPVGTDRALLGLGTAIERVLGPEPGPGHSG